MRKVTGIGETVYDIVFRDGQPQAAVPGGSTFNSMISVGRCGIPASFLSEVGSDKIGEIIKDFLTYNGVSTASVNTLPGKTPLSLAFLNENDDAEYSFYRDSYDKHPDFTYPELEKDDIVIFGSFYALNPKVRPQVRRFLEYARSREAIIYYDINFRPSHKKDLGECWDSIWENIGFADILRGSHEDFHTLFGIDDAAVVYSEKIGGKCPHFICTRGSDPLEIFDVGGFRKEYPVGKIKTVSTIGAGDSFNAGIAYAIVKYGITRDMVCRGLPEELWDKLTACAQAFSADCCKSMYNYITPQFGEDMAL